MANTYKDIVITPNKGSSTDDPKIVFSGGNTSVNTDVTLRVYPDSNGTLSFEGSAGQLFSITNDLSGSLFTVNDVSGIPSIEVDALGNVDLAPFGGNVGIGTSNPVFKLDVQGDARITGNLTLGDATTDTITVNAANFNLANNVSFDSGTLFIDKNNDRIGIGTTNPTAKLDVKASDGTGLYIGTSSVNYYDANVHVLRSTLQIERMRIESGGNVGIGTSNPTAKLTINGGGITGQGTGLFVANGDITTSRSGGTTGAIYFGSDSATKFLYHDGTAYYFGSTGNVITPQSYQAAAYYDTDSNYYMDFNGGSRINNLQILGAVSATTNTAFYYDAALEVRELNLAGAQADIANCAPRIGMHWGGRVASQIVLESSGRIAIRNNPGNGYEAFAAGATYIAGSLGIGTSPTGTPLTVSRADQGTITTFYGPTSSILYQDYGSTSYLWHNNSHLHFGTYTANNLYISTNSSARITVTSAGNVGIGTTSPTQQLDVNGGIAITAAAARIVGDFNNATVANRVLFQTSSTNAPTSIGAIPNGTGSVASFISINNSNPENSAYLSISATSTDARLWSGIVGSGTYLPITFFAGGSERMRIDSSGNVAIGTTSTSARLQVTGTSNTANVLYLNVGGNYLRANGFGSGSINLVGFENNVLIGNEFSGGALALIAGGSERMRITSGGSVGIGTSPSHALHVNGNALVSGTFFNNGISDTGGNAKFNWSVGAGSGINAYGPIHTDGTHTFLAPVFSSAPRGSIVLGDGMGSDVLAFNPPSTAELYNGTTWSSTTVTDAIKGLFQGKHSSSFSTYEITTANAGVRFTWTSSEIPLYIFLNALLITSLTQGNSVVATLETSTDSGSTWTTVTTTNVFNTWPGYTIHNLVNSLNASSNRMRISFVRSGASNGNSIWLGQIGLINSYQSGNRLFNWNVNRWLGVGTISNGPVTPQSPLDVAGAIVARSGAITTAVASTSILDNNAGIARLISRGPDTSTNGTFQLISTRSDGSSVGNRVTIDAGGRFGLGTTSPGSRFVIASSGEGVSVDLSAGIQSFGFNRNAADGAVYNASSAAWQFTARDTYFALEGYNGVNTFSTASSSIITATKTNAFVGIGTTTPSQRLTVAGGQILVGPTDNGNSYINFYSTSYRVGASSGLEIQTGSGDVVRFLRGSTETARIDASGNMGLGATPNVPLNIINFQVGTKLSLNFGSTTGALTYNSYWDGAFKYMTSDFALDYRMNSGVGAHTWYTAPSGTAGSSFGYTERMRLDANGNVGIGTTAPSTRLEVAALNDATINFPLMVRNLATTGSGGGSGTGIQFISHSGVDAGKIYAVNDVAGSTSMIFANYSGEFMRGNGSSVCIGTTTSATSKLRVVAGAGLTALSVTGAGNAGLIVDYLGASDNYYDAGAHIFRSTSGTTERMRINASGNVGIGNTAPVLKLEVAGNMSVDAFIENSATIATNYTITTGRNAMTAGPVTINSGVTVTVPSGSTWTIV